MTSKSSRRATLFLEHPAVPNCCRVEVDNCEGVDASLHHVGDAAHEGCRAHCAKTENCVFKMQRRPLHHISSHILLSYLSGPPHSKYSEVDMKSGGIRSIYLSASFRVHRPEVTDDVRPCVKMPEPVFSVVFFLWGRGSRVWARGLPCTRPWATWWSPPPSRTSG